MHLFIWQGFRYVLMTIACRHGKRRAATPLERWMIIAQYSVLILMYICAKMNDVLLESKKQTALSLFPVDIHFLWKTIWECKFFFLSYVWYITFSLLSKSLVVSDTRITAQSSSYIRPLKRLNGTMIWPTRNAVQCEPGSQYMHHNSKKWRFLIIMAAADKTGNPFAVIWWV